MYAEVISSGVKEAVLLTSTAWSVAAVGLAPEMQAVAPYAPDIGLKLYSIALAFMGAATSLSYVDNLTARKAWSFFLAGVGLSIVVSPIAVRYLVLSFPQVLAPLQFETEIATSYVTGAVGFYVFPIGIGIARNPFTFWTWVRGGFKGPAPWTPQPDAESAP